MHISEISRLAHSHNEAARSVPHDHPHRRQYLFAMRLLQNDCKATARNSSLTMRYQARAARLSHEIGEMCDVLDATLPPLVVVGCPQCGEINNEHHYACDALSRAGVLGMYGKRPKKMTDDQITAEIYSLDRNGINLDQSARRDRLSAGLHSRMTA